MKTPEEKREYCRQWRIKNREKYLAQRKIRYQKNIGQYREESKKRASKYYHEVEKAKRAADPQKYKALDREHSIKRRQVRRTHLRELRERLGGKCTECGYSENIDILQFHHHEKNKEANVTNFQNYQKREKEALKCILLCPNCHAIETLNALRNTNDSIP